MFITLEVLNYQDILKYRYYLLLYITGTLNNKWFWSKSFTGHNKVLRIPPGARTIKITSHKPGKSYLGWHYCIFILFRDILFNLLLEHESLSNFILKVSLHGQEDFKDTKGVIRIRKSSKDEQHNGQKKKDKQRSAKHYTKSKRSSNTNPTKNRGWIRVLWKGKQLLLH
jgi:hypothetical protein